MDEGAGEGGDYEACVTGYGLPVIGYGEAWIGGLLLKDALYCVYVRAFTEDFIGQRDRIQAEV